MSQIDIFGKTEIRPPITEGIKYAGSKLKLLSPILSIADELDVESVFDGFSGTTRVSQAFAQLGYQVISNDISLWSKTFGQCYLLNTKPSVYFQQMIDHLNNTQPKNGWYTEHYGGTPVSDTKRPWQIHNTMMLDGIREEIDRITHDEIEKSVLLTSLIHALDEVDSTLGHYAAYLKDWSPRSYKKMFLKTPRLFNSTNDHSVNHADIMNVVDSIHADLAYFDPPYGSNNEKMPPSRVRYSSYYHVWTTIIQNDSPKIFGRANRREDTRDEVSASVFEEFRRTSEGKFIAIDAIEQLIRRTNARYILLSYSSGGRATKSELVEAIEQNGKLIKTVSIDYKKNVMANMRWTHEWINSDGDNTEYLLLMEKK